MDKALLDTDILSEILKKNDQSVVGRAREYRRRHGRFTLSAATVMEVVRGLCRLDAHRQLEFFLDSLDEAEVLPVDEEIAILAGRIDGALLKSGQQIGINDVLIAATAMHYGLSVVTDPARGAQGKPSASSARPGPSPTARRSRGSRWRPSTWRRH